jgi:hypothetical protein
LDLGVDAIADGNIDQAIFRAERHCRLGAQFRQRVEPGAGPAAKDDS